jgi:hypothetical protein
VLRNEVLVLTEETRRHWLRLCLYHDTEKQKPSSHRLIPNKQLHYK